MPASSSRETLARQWELLKLLKQYPQSSTASELTQQLNASGYNIGKRQVLRDLDFLSTIFAIADKGSDDKRGMRHWFWTEGAASAFPSITLTEALGLSMLEQHLGDLIPNQHMELLAPRFLQAKNKLESLQDKTTAARWSHRMRAIPSTFNLQPPTIDNEILSACHQAILEERQLEVEYTSIERGTPKTMRLHAHGLLKQGQAYYLISTANKYTELRTYSLSRITKPTILDEKAKLDRSFDIDKYISDNGFMMTVNSGAKIKLKLSVEPWLATVLSETPISSDQTINFRDDYAVVTAHVTHTHQLEWWLLSMGTSALVLSPAALVRRMKATTSDLGALYNPSPL